MIWPGFRNSAATSIAAWTTPPGLLRRSMTRPFRSVPPSASMLDFSKAPVFGSKLATRTYPMPGFRRYERSTLGASMSSGESVNWSRRAFPGLRTSSRASCCRASVNNCSNWSKVRRFRGMLLMMRISSPAESPALADGVPGNVCRMITRPGRTDTTLPNPFRSDFSISFNCPY